MITIDTGKKIICKRCDEFTWRDIQEELPKDDGPVLVYVPSSDPNKGLRAIGWYDPERGWSNPAITHWMPLTAPLVKT